MDRLSPEGASRGLQEGETAAIMTGAQPPCFLLGHPDIQPLGHSIQEQKEVASRSPSWSKTPRAKGRWEEQQ